MLLEAALREVDDFASWTRDGGFTWNKLAARLGVSRQALEAKNKGELGPAVERLRADLKKTDGGQNSTKLVRRTFDQRIQHLEAEREELRTQLDRWIEKWVTVEENCVTLNISPDQILAPLAKPNRLLSPTKSRG